MPARERRSSGTERFTRLWCSQAECWPYRTVSHFVCVADLIEKTDFGYRCLVSICTVMRSQEGGEGRGAEDRELEGEA